MRKEYEPGSIMAQVKELSTMEYLHSEESEDEPVEERAALEARIANLESRASDAEAQCVAIFDLLARRGFGSMGPLHQRISRILDDNDRMGALLDAAREQSGRKTTT